MSRTGVDDPTPSAAQNEPHIPPSPPIDATASWAIYLTGSHHWDVFQDSAKLGGPVTNRFDHKRYLQRLASGRHNLMRMWSWEAGENHSYYEPAPWVRTRLETARDGKPKFDLDRFNEEYFKRLRSRTIAARDQGIYVGVMLFQGLEHLQSWLWESVFMGRRSLLSPRWW